MFGVMIQVIMTRPTILYDRCIVTGGSLHSLARFMLFNTRATCAPMAILSEHIDDEPQGAIEHLERLRIPPEFAQYNTLEDKLITDKLDEWKTEALTALTYLHGVFGTKHNGVLDLDSVYTFAGFQGDGEWTSVEMSALSSGK